MSNPDLDIRYVLPDRIEEYSNCLIKDNGYDYPSNNELDLSIVILHSDQGVQFTSWDFVNFCKDNNVTQSMSKAGCLYDNAPMEARYS